MSKAEQVIIAALQRGPLFYETHVGNGWHFPSPHPSRQFGAPPRKRYFRTMDVRRVLASGAAVQIGNQVVKA